MRISKWTTAVFCASAMCWGQAPRAVRSETASSFALRHAAGSETYQITNTTYHVTGAFLPGRPKEQRLVLRKTTRLKQVVDEMGSEASTSLEAWPMGSEMTQKPVYSLTVSGDDGVIVDGVLFQVSRGLEDVAWWSVYQFGTGRHLFDTHAPLASVSISEDEVRRRYAGLEVPADDTKDPRLKDPQVVAVLSYSSAERVLREVMITSNDPQRARLFRSYFDMTRVISMQRDKLRITFQESYPSTSAPMIVEIPLVGDDLHLSRATLPAGLRLAAWTR